MLTNTQIEARRGKLTASRIACLMCGATPQLPPDPVKVDRLWREMIGDEVEEDLSEVWAVRLGEATEKLNLYWYERRTNYLIGRCGEVVNHPVFEWAACTLDGWDYQLSCPIECKHVGGREPLEVIIDRYQPQMQWQMEITGAPQCALSVIMGANEPRIEYILFDHAYATEMIRRGSQFMDHVRNRTPPVALPAMPPPADVSKVYDMSLNNEWCFRAADWLNNRNAAEVCKQAEKILKHIVPADARKCFGAGVQITRDRAGRLSLRVAE